MYVRACMRVCIANSHQDTRPRPAHDQNRTTGTHDNRKREEHWQSGKPEYICMFAANEKKVQKKLKKNSEIIKKRINMYQ